MTITSERTEVGERDEHPLAEALAVERDLLQHADELRAVAKRLWPDRDDAHVRSELVVVLEQLRQAEADQKLVDRG